MNPMKTGQRGTALAKILAIITVSLAMAPLAAQVTAQPSPRTAAEAADRVAPPMHAQTPAQMPAQMPAPMPAQMLAQLVDPMRGRTAVGDESKPPPMHPVENKDQRRERAYSMQPPTIPHKIDGYQVDKRFNRCLDCHAREKAFESRAVPLSVTHYMDRSGNVLGEVSPRRYFCNQCHVSQVEAKPLVPNDFRDIAEVLGTAAGAQGGAGGKATKH